VTDLGPVQRLQAMQTTLWAVHDAAQQIRTPLGAFYATLSDEQKAQLRQIVQEKPDRFMRELAEEVQKRLGVTVCRQTVGEWVRDLGFTRKKSRCTPRSKSVPM